jgi:hypothetical protein
MAADGAACEKFPDICIHARTDPKSAHHLIIRCNAFSPWREVENIPNGQQQWYRNELNEMSFSTSGRSFAVRPGFLKKA